METQTENLPVDGQFRSERYPIKFAIAAMTGFAFFTMSFDLKSHPQYYFSAIVASLAFVPAIQRPLRERFAAIRSPSGKVKWVIFSVVFVLSARYFLYSANRAERDLFPKFHDEYMYLLQARMMSQGRLWMPQHRLADFLDSFFVMVRPVYASTYFPGTAIFYIPGVWLNLAPWGTSVLIAAGLVAVLYLVATDLLDGLAGLVAALMAIATQELRGLSVMAMSHTTMPLLLLLTMWSYLQWRKNHSILWLITVGVFSGWAAITRPTDALCVILPIGAALLWEIRRTGIRVIATTLFTAIIAALPLLSLQLILNKGCTGSFVHTPIGEYGKENFPGLALGVGHRVVSDRSPSSLPQTQDYYLQFLRPAILQFSNDKTMDTWLQKRLSATADVGLPGHLLYWLLPIGLLGVRTVTRFSFVVPAILIPTLYAFFPIYLKHYGLIACPAYILLALMGMNQIRLKFPRFDAPIVLAVITVAIGSLPEIRGVRDPFMQAPYLADINTKLAGLEHKPAVVLFRYETGRTDVHEEPVYNLDTAWPDDAPIIRLQDRGSDNRRAFEYFAKEQPQRFFYRYDRTTTELTPLGFAKDLAMLSMTP